MAYPHTLRESVKTAVSALELLLPPIRMIRKWDYERRRFPNIPDAYLGIYDSFEEARRAAPGKTGYDNGDMAKIYDDRIGKVFPFDYPVLFWLQRILRPGSSVFDLGGHVGIAFYSFATLIDYPPDLRWVVCDVPAVIARGADLAKDKGAWQLRFTDTFQDAKHCDILLALGVLQYIETDFGKQLAKLSRRPTHIILNRTPMVAGPSFITLQNTLHSYNPYRVFDRGRLVQSVTDLGFDLMDSWLNPELSCHVPYHDKPPVNGYTGLYFRSR